jgi:16S rRNA (cytidine1402-2'-O)-methyltransferase
VVVYEAARRLVPSLQDLHEVLGPRQVVVVRELTKMFEEILRGRVDELLRQLEQRLGDRSLQGEVTLLLAGGQATPQVVVEDITAAIERLRGEGLSLKEIARTLARERGLSRREVYQAGLALGHS